MGYAARPQGVQPDAGIRQRLESASNQGLYNGFLAAGLIWGLYLGEAGFQIKAFFLLCVAIAGLYGAAAVGRKILYIQTVPALAALIALWLDW